MQKSQSIKTNFPAEIKAKTSEHLVGGQQSADMMLLLVSSRCLLCFVALFLSAAFTIRTIISVPSLLAFILELGVSGVFLSTDTSNAI